MITTPEQMREAAAQIAETHQVYQADVCAARIRAIPIAPQPATDWTTCAADMLRVWDTWFGGSADGDRAASDRLAIASAFAAQAFEHAAASGITADGAPTALLRAFLLALIDKLHPDLDYLRADPSSGEKARADRGAVAPPVVAAPQPTPIVDGSGPGPHYVADMLSQFVASVWHLLDNSETSGPIDDPIITIMQSDFDEVSQWLDRLEALPSGSETRLSAGELVAAYLSPQPVAVTVKPLVWKASGFEGNYKAGSLGLGYFVECAARQFSCSVSDGRGSLFKVLYRGASEEAAKAAAQRHHDALLRAELAIQPADPQPATDQAADMKRIAYKAGYVQAECGLPCPADIDAAFADWLAKAAPQPVAVTVKPLLPDGLIDALRHQRQIDMEGIEVAVSRQACDEAADILSALTIQPAGPLSDPRVKALVEAAGPLNDMHMWTESADDMEVVIVSVGTVRHIRSALRAIGGEA